MKITKHHQECVYHYTFDEYKHVTAYGHSLVLHSFRVVIRPDRPFSSHIIFVDTRNEEFFFSFQDYDTENTDSITSLGKECLDYHMQDEPRVENIPLASEILENKPIQPKPIQEM